MSVTVYAINIKCYYIAYKTRCYQNVLKLLTLLQNRLLNYQQSVLKAKYIALLTFLQKYPLKHKQNILQ